MEFTINSTFDEVKFLIKLQSLNAYKIQFHRQYREFSNPVFYLCLLIPRLNIDNQINNL